MEEEEVHTPEFIYLDPMHQRRKEALESFSKIESVKIPKKFRFLCLGFGFLSFFWVLGCLILSIFTFIGSLLTLRKVPVLNKISQERFGRLKNSLAFCLGLNVAIFSPYLGLGIIIMYFMIDEPKVSDSLSSYLKGNIEEYFQEGL